ncbi:MAG: M20/M25/M40 family metallo-hydrolase [Candidatus Dadabacteria bacterium]|nr:MAG: M20/M25/M40 family metallo-hydrolase [Candidatus Dadabacteria bacterium]
MPITLKKIDQYYQENYETIIEQFSKFLSFKSVSTDTAFEEELLSCANWLMQFIKERLNFNVELIPTVTGKPLILAKNHCGEDKKTLLYYGHYDVQPADPYDKWLSDPFVAEIRDGRIFARGAQDNKGQTFFVLKALEFLVQQNSLNCNIILLIEGEEECGSVGIEKALPELKTTLEAADLLLVCDTGTLSPLQGAITMGLRGICGLTVSLGGLRCDLHSGVHGGVAPNPAIELVRLLASLYDTNLRVKVPGFYDDIIAPTEEELAEAKKAPITDELYKQIAGAPPMGGEKGKDFHLRRSFLPTLEINGLSSGYQGPGMKTIIPQEAFAKLSCRTAFGQSSKKIIERLESTIKEMAPDYLELKITDVEAGGDGVRARLDSPHVQKAKQLLKQVYNGADPILIWEGASIPVVSNLCKTADTEPLMVGFGLEEDNIHAPNESFSLEQFRRGLIFTAKFVEDFASEQDNS